jgi:hypothetical protein
MEIATLTTFLTPFLPFLRQLGDKTSDQITTTASKQFGDVAWSKAQGIWQRLRPQVEAQDDLRGAIDQVVAKPDSAARQGVLQEELAALLAQDADLAAAITQILADSQQNTGITISQKAKTVEGQMIGQMQASEIKTIGKIGDVQGNVQF